MATKPDSQTPETTQAADAAQPEVLRIDDACQRLSETVGSPEALAGFYVASEGLEPADLATWRNRFDDWLKQPA